MDVGKRITELREARGLTTNRLANLCGLSQSFVRSVELGEKGITVDNLGLICDTLKISLKDFFDVPDERTAAPEEPLFQSIERLNTQQRRALAQFLQTLRQ